MSAPAPAVAPLRVALSAPAITTLALLQLLRLAAPGPLVSFLCLEAAFVATAAVAARRVPGLSWGHVPAMWLGVALGAIADALWLGGGLAGLPVLLGAAAPALAVGFALAQSWPRRNGDAAGTGGRQDQ